MRTVVMPPRAGCPCLFLLSFRCSFCVRCGQRRPRSAFFYFLSSGDWPSRGLEWMFFGCGGPVAAAGWV